LTELYCKPSNQSDLNIYSKKWYI